MATLVAVSGVKIPLVAGLAWRHSDDRPSTKKLRELSRQLGRWGMVHTTAANTIQIATCDLPGEVKSISGHRSLAAAVADQIQWPWRGLYEIGGNLYWYIAVRDGGEIIPSGDVVGTYDEVLKVRNRHDDLGTWHDESGGLEELAELVQKAPKQPGLRDLQRSPLLPLFYLTGGLAGLCVVAGAAAWIHGRHEAAIEAQQIARARAIAAAHKAKADEAARVLPWTREPMVSESIDACRRAWDHQLLAQLGWALSGWQCEVSARGISVSADWARAGGSAADAPGNLAADANTSHQFLDQAERFSPSSPLAMGDDQAKRVIWSVVQAAGIGMKMDDAAPKPILPGAEPDAVAPGGSPWGSKQTDLSLVAPPWVNGMGASLATVPGLRIKSISWAAKAGNNSVPWAVSGTLYSMHEGAEPRVLQATPAHVVKSERGGV